MKIIGGIWHFRNVYSASSQLSKSSFVESEESELVPDMKRIPDYHFSDVC